MSKPQDPPRLLDASSDTTDAVRAVLRAGKRELPGPSDLARLAARLPLGPLPPPSGSPPPAPSSPPALSPPAPTRLPRPSGLLTTSAATPSVIPGAIVGAILGLGVVAGVWLRDAAVAAPSAAMPAAVVTAGVGAGAASPTTNAKVSVGLNADSSLPVDRKVDRAASESARQSAEDRSPSGASPSPGDLARGSIAAAPRAEDTGLLSPDASDAGASGGAISPLGAAAPEGETEVHLLQRAQSALDLDPGSALALTGEHARRFPHGALDQESELIAIRALLALGRAPEARARAERLLERFPGSAYRGRIESLGLGGMSQKEASPSPRTR